MYIFVKKYRKSVHWTRWYHSNKTKELMIKIGAVSPIALDIANIIPLIGAPIE